MLTLLMMASTLLYALVCLGGIMFAMTRRRQFPAAAKRVAMGLATLLVNQLIGWFGAVFLSRMANTPQIGFYHAGLAMFQTLAGTVGLVIIISAAFIKQGRHPDDSRSSDELAPNALADDHDGSNPYSAPSSQ